MRVHITTLRVYDEAYPDVNHTAQVLEFDRSDQGKWLRDNSYRQIEYTIQEHPEVYGYGINIWAWLSERNLTFYKLKWS